MDVQIDQGRNIARNQRRDTANRLFLRELGWTPVVVWECQTLDDNLSDLLKRILNYGRYGRNRSWIEVPNG